MAISTRDGECLIIAAAQIAAVPGDVQSNISTHLRFARCAAMHGVQLLVFPELSLTGYELGLAPGHVLSADDPELRQLRAVATESGMAIVAGAPVAGDGGCLHIGAFLFQPDGTAVTHTKVHVHSSEMPPFTAGPGGPPQPVAGTPVGLAICADASHPEHAAATVAAGARLYAVGVFIEEEAYARKTSLIAGYSRQYRIPALMANYAGVTGGAPSAGKSAIWADDGSLVIAAPGAEPALVIAARRDDRWARAISSP
ncbi:MAG: carbon-nitrogen hydrolase family protein [Bryobacterales bacterium]|nr:carbon-nitrogen hydrolase family protein [Bryobacterales bacterium]